MDFGAENLFKKLRSAILSRPANYNIITPLTHWQKRWQGKINLPLALRQHSDMADILRAEGVKCHYLETIAEKQDQVFTRDLGFIFSKGAFVGRLKEAARTGEESAFTDFCISNKIPIVHFEKSDYFEGGDFFSLDASSCILGLGPRTNMASHQFKNLVGKEVHIISHKAPHHLDAVFNMASPSLGVFHPESFSEVPSFLDKIEMISMDEEELDNLSSNFLSLKENKILADINCRNFNKRLEKLGVEVVEADVSELKKGGGSIRCMTLPLWRR